MSTRTDINASNARLAARMEAERRIALTLSSESLRALLAFHLETLVDMIIDGDPWDLEADRCVSILSGLIAQVPADLHANLADLDAYPS